jgi:Domain of unknown function (DUF4956)
MTPFVLDPAYLTLLERFGVNIVAAATLLFALFYRRYRDKELAISGMLFNLFIFGVLSVLGKVQFSLAAGFGLFAMLAMFTLRSEPLAKIEIAYFFGAVAIAVICSVPGTALEAVVVIVGVVVLGAWIVDHPRVLPSVDHMRLVLDKIDKETLGEPEAMRVLLSRKLGVQVMSYQVTAVDYIADSARVNVFYRR